MPDNRPGDGQGPDIPWPENRLSKETSLAKEDVYTLVNNPLMLRRAGDDDTVKWAIIFTVGSVVGISLGLLMLTA